MKPNIIIALAIFIAVIGTVLLSFKSHYIYTPESNATSTARIEAEEVSLLFTGDIMLGRNVENLRAKYGDDYPFQAVGEYLRQFDAVVGNLEGPILINHVKTTSGSLKFSFDSKSPSLLARHNVSIVSLANNHTFDHGSAGYYETAQALKAVGVTPVGHPFSSNIDYVVRKELKGQKFIFAGFNITNPHFDFTEASTTISRINKQADEYLIVMVHGGEEYKLISNTRQQNFYRTMIDLGADAVIAHHPHVVQEIESYKGKIIFYSLGNFVFDQYFSRDVEEGLLVKAVFKQGDVVYELVPIRSARSKATLMTDAERNDFLMRLSTKSSAGIREMIKSGKI